MDGNRRATASRPSPRFRSCPQVDRGAAAAPEVRRPGEQRAPEGDDHVDGQVAGGQGGAGYARGQPDDVAGPAVAEQTVERQARSWAGVDDRGADGRRLAVAVDGRPLRLGRSRRGRGRREAVRRRRRSETARHVNGEQGCGHGDTVGTRPRAVDGRPIIRRRRRSRGPTRGGAPRREDKGLCYPRGLQSPRFSTPRRLVIAGWDCPPPVRARVLRKPKPCPALT